MDAAAVERPTISTHVPRNKVVPDHYPSWLHVPLHGSRAIDSVIRLAFEKPIRARHHARPKVLGAFQVSLVNQSTLDTFRLLQATPLELDPQLKGLF